MKVASSFALFSFLVAVAVIAWPTGSNPSTKYKLKDSGPFYCSPPSGKGVIEGIVRNAVNKKPLTRVRVVIRKKLSDKRPAAIAITDPTGFYRTRPLKPGEYFVEFHHKEFSLSRRRHIQVDPSEKMIVDQSLSRRSSIEQSAAPWLWRVILNWTDSKTNAVRDIDSYLHIPAVARPIHYNVKNFFHGTHRELYTNLDVDETRWRGPETVTVYKLVKAVRGSPYIYYVSNYSDRGSSTALGNSRVHVELHKSFCDGVYRSYDLYPNHVIVAEETDESGIPIGEEYSQNLASGKNSGTIFELFRIDKAGKVHDTLRYNNSLWVSGH